MACPGWWPTPKAGTAGGVFSQDQELRQQIEERLRQGPWLEAPPPAALHGIAPRPRWTLDTIRATCDRLADYTPSGVWRFLQRLGLRLRSARVQQFSPDPEYGRKLLDLEMALWEARRYPRTVVAVFLDQMGFTRWPDPAPDWGAEPAVADRRGAKQGLWRLMGALNPFTGQVHYLDNYIIGREKVIACYAQLVAAYPGARRLYAIQDNWSIHRHPDVLAALRGWPQIEPVWLPTYAPWLNPIEKLWRWLRQDVLHLHRLADDWKALRARVRAFLEQFAQGSQRLLEYVGLRGNGLIARMIHGP
jgi:transposase